VNTDKQIIEFFQIRWPAYCKSATGLRPDQRPAWVWVIAARKAAAFLEAIRPFVICGRVETKIAHGLAFQAQKWRGSGCRSEEYREAQWIAYWWMAELNARGRQLPMPQRRSTCPNAAAHRQ